MTALGDGVSARDGDEHATCFIAVAEGRGDPRSAARPLVQSSPVERPWGVPCNEMALPWHRRADRARRPSLVFGCALPARGGTGVAVPLHALAEEEGVPPIMTHMSLVLNNWRRLDPAGPIVARNLACSCRFLGGQDETWFYTATVEIEAKGGGIFGALLQVLFSGVKIVLSPLPEAICPRR